MSGCEALATKAELQALEAQINRMIPQPEKPQIIQAAVGEIQWRFPPIWKDLGAIWAWIQQNGPLIAQIIPLVMAVESIKQQVSSIYRRIAGLESAVEQLKKTDAQLQAQIDYHDVLIARANAEIAKANAEINRVAGIATTAQAQARRALSEAEIAQSIASQAIGAANRAQITAEQAAVAAAAAFLRAEQANSSAIDAANRADRAQMVANEAKVAVGVVQTMARADHLAQQAQINRLGIQQTTMRADLIGLRSQVGTKASSKDLVTRTQLKGIETQVKEIPTLKSSAKQLESTVNQGLKSSAISLTSSLEAQKQQIARTIVTTQTFDKRIQDVENKVSNTLTNTNSLSSAQVREIAKAEVIAQSKVNEQQYTDIKAQIGAIPVIVTAGIATTLAPQLAQINAQTKPDAISNAAANGVCSTTRPGGCMNNNILNPLKGKLDDLASGLGLVGQGAQLALLRTIDVTTRSTNGIVRAMQPVLNTVNTGLNTLTTFTETAWKATRMDKILNALNTVLVLHNAAMLSRNLAGSLGDLLSAGLNNIISLVKNEEFDDININETVGNTVENILKGMLGVETYNGVSETFNKYSRILNAAANILHTTMSAMAGLAEGLELLGQYTGKIGNALKKSGAVLESSYQWMSETISVKTGKLDRFQKVIDGLESVENVASDLVEVTEEFREAQESIGIIGSEIGRIRDELSDEEERKTEAETTGKQSSQPPNIQLSDLNKSFGE